MRLIKVKGAQDNPAIWLVKIINTVSQGVTPQIRPRSRSEMKNAIHRDVGPYLKEMKDLIIALHSDLPLLLLS